MDVFFSDVLGLRAAFRIMFYKGAVIVLGLSEVNLIDQFFYETYVRKN